MAAKRDRVYFIVFAATEIYVRGSNPFYQRRDESHDILYTFSFSSFFAVFVREEHSRIRAPLSVWPSLTPCGLATRFADHNERPNRMQ